MRFKFLFIAAICCAMISCTNNSQEQATVDSKTTTEATLSNSTKNDNMKLGAFSISLSVKDIHASKAFYENLGFEAIGGNLEQNYLVMKNGDAKIGIFQGMFEGNMMTFNPGWDANGKNTETFDDVRTIQKKLKESDAPFVIEADETTTGPASFIVTDPDGNVILFDQHR